MTRIIDGGEATRHGRADYAALLIVQGDGLGVRKRHKDVQWADAL